MNKDCIVCTEQDFIAHFVQNSPQIMWFLGAGTSRTAGMPTAMDIIWDLKQKYFCLQENQELQVHNLHNKAIRDKIQNYMDGKGFPMAGSSGEYSFYFDLMFGEDCGAQQQYIAAQLDPRKTSLNIGHRVLAALLELGLARVVFTTNFDDVIEDAFSAITGKRLSSFHLEGSYAALDALNAERFPIYAKMHGDFRYRNIKNLSADLLHNDKEIQKCFLAASNRYGIIVTGYSGRDSNVMNLFRLVLEQNNPFPQGLFWVTTSISRAPEPVVELLSLAKSKGVRAHLVETGTFDIMLSKIWRQLPAKPDELDSKVRTAKAQVVSIPLPPPGKKYPILRMNALAISEFPKCCSTVEYKKPLTYQELSEKDREHRPDIVWAYTDRLLFWGRAEDAVKLLDEKNIIAIKGYNCENEGASIAESNIMKSFYEHALARSLCHDRPLHLRRKDKTYYAVVDNHAIDDCRLRPLKDALGYRGTPGDINGPVTGMKGTFWAEALSIKIEQKNNAFWLLIEPDIWISPLVARKNAFDVLRAKKLRRYNNQAFNLLSAWIQVLFGSVGDGRVVEVSCFPDADCVPRFKLNTRTAYSYQGGSNA